MGHRDKGGELSCCDCLTFIGRAYHLITRSQIAAVTEGGNDVSRKSSSLTNAAYPALPDLASDLVGPATTSRSTYDGIRRDDAPIHAGIQ